MAFADLEPGLHRRSEDHYAVDLRFAQPQSDTDTRLADDSISAVFDMAALRALALDPAAYGQALSTALFASPTLRQAFAQARAAAAALDSRLRLRLWYVPGFADARQAFEKWPTIVRSLARGQATPVIGPTLAERTLGAPSALALRWAERYHFPLAAYEREQLHEVAQYLSVNQAPSFPREDLADEVRRALARRYAADLDVDDFVQELAAQLAAAPAPAARSGVRRR